MATGRWPDAAGKQAATGVRDSLVVAFFLVICWCSQLGLVGCISAPRNAPDVTSQYSAEKRRLWETGHAAADAGDFTRAREQFDSLLELGQKTDDPASIAYGHDGLGMVLRRTGEPEKAIPEFEMALVEIRKTDKHDDIIAIQGNLAYAQLEAGFPEMAQPIIEETLAYVEKKKNYREIAVGATQLGQLHTEAGRFDLAEEYFQQSLVAAQELGDSNWLYAARKNIILVRQERDQFRALEKLLVAGALELETEWFPVHFVAFNHYLARIQIDAYPHADISEPESLFMKFVDFREPPIFRDTTVPVYNRYRLSGQMWTAALGIKDKYKLAHLSDGNDYSTEMAYMQGVLVSIRRQQFDLLREIIATISSDSQDYRSKVRDREQLKIELTRILGGELRNLTNYTYSDAERMIIAKDLLVEGPLILQYLDSELQEGFHAKIEGLASAEPYEALRELYEQYLDGSDS